MPPKRKLLFITNSEHGAANVHLAVSYEIVMQYPDVQVHFISFPSLEKHLRAISAQASKSSLESTNALPIFFHAIPGSSVTEAMAAQFNVGFQEAMTHPPGVAGAIQSYRSIAQFAAAWSGEEHLRLYAAAASIIKDIDPTLVVLDPVFVPGIEACRHLEIKYVILSPNAMKDVLAQQQPRGAMFWKYPVVSSGFPYPLPLYLIPLNIYLFFRLILSLLLSKPLSTKTAYLKQHNHKASPPYSTAADDPIVPWFFPSLPEIDFSLTFVPKNVTPCGPIIVNFAAVADTDAELARWLGRRPTVFINLGSLYRFDERSADSMLGAIEFLLERIGDVQVLWKMRPLRDGDPWVGVMRMRLGGDGGRVRVVNWVSAEPAAILASKSVILAVHHGGASSYHEAISAGIPQILLPMWNDLYDFTTRVEYLGIGLWGNRKSAPSWDATELGAAMVKVVQDNEVSRAMRRKAKELAEICQREVGRKVAARKIYEMM